MYEALATAVLIAHLAFVAFVVLGGFFVLRRPRLAWLHVPMTCWGVYTEFAGVVCPLTPLENHFRALAGRPTYAGGFLDHYITAALYPEGLTRGMQLALGVAVLLLNATIYARLIARRR